MNRSLDLGLSHLVFSPALQEMLMWMRSLLWVLVFFACVAGVVCEGRPFKRAQILSGGGFQTAIFLGYVDGLSKKNWEADLLIASCGGSIAATVLAAFPTAKERLEFVKSREFHQALLSIQLNPVQASSTKLPASTMGLLARANNLFRTGPVYLPLPRFFSRNESLLLVPEKWSGKMESILFPTQKQKSIVVGFRALFSEDEVQRELEKEEIDRKFYQEVYFTDKDTELELKDRISIIAENYPKSAVAPQTATVSSISLSTAARISISDIGYVHGLKVGDAYYGGGFINLLPVELALDLADEVVAIRATPFTAIENASISTSFGYDGNKRFTYVTKMLEKENDNADRIHWLEVANDIDKTYAESGLNPKVNLQAKEGEPLMSLNVPIEYSSYVERVDKLYHWGLKKAEATFVK